MEVDIDVELRAPHPKEARAREAHPADTSEASEGAGIETQWRWVVAAPLDPVLTEDARPRRGGSLSDLANDQRGTVHAVIRSRATDSHTAPMVASEGLGPCASPRRRLAQRVV